LLLLTAATVAVQAQTVVYDNLSTTATAGYSQPNVDLPVFGDSLTLAQPGVLTWFSASLYNSTSGGNSGSILTGTMEIKFYDNTVPYTGGAIANPLLATGIMPWDFTADGGLPAGYYATDEVDFSFLNVYLPQEVLVTQQFTMTDGTSTRNGLTLFSDPVTGSSPDTVYISSSTTPPDLYTFGGNPGQFGYRIEVVPEPTPYLAAGLLLGFAAWQSYRRPRSA